MEPPADYCPCREAKGNRILCLHSVSSWKVHGNAETHPYEGMSEWTEESVQHWTQAIKALVEEDTKKPQSEAIDSVVWQVESMDEPTEEMWQILDGLSPKHLLVAAGFEERVSLDGFGTIQRQWSELESLHLMSLIQPAVAGEFPQVLSGIQSLVLDYCYAEGLVPPGATKLKQLSIIENSACDMFIHALEDEQNPGLAAQLEVLDIETTTGNDMCSYQPQDFMNRLKSCTSLRELRYTAGIVNGLDVIDIASCIPESVETLIVTFTRSIPFLRNFDTWLKYAADPKWLPHLKVFKMAIDTKDNGVSDLKAGAQYGMGKIDVSIMHPPAVFDRDFDEKRGELYNLLKVKKPYLTLQQ